MRNYVDRLIRCGFSADRATAVCIDFAKNLPLDDLIFFVQSVEEEVYVDESNNSQ